jgi:hypothetical protein
VLTRKTNERKWVEKQENKESRERRSENERWRYHLQLFTQWTNKAVLSVTQKTLLCNKNPKAWANFSCLVLFCFAVGKIARNHFIWSLCCYIIDEMTLLL